MFNLIFQTLNLIYEMISSKPDCDSGRLKVFIETFLPALLEQLMFNDKHPNCKKKTLQILAKIKETTQYENNRYQHSIYTSFFRC